jgi:UDPglucose 6-dehydrogenase
LDYLQSRTPEENAKKKAKSFENPYEACQNAHAIAILTEWDEFTAYDWQRIYDNMQKPTFIFDGRNFLNGEKLSNIGFIYRSIG